MSDRSQDKLFTPERQQAILAYVETHKKATVAELCLRFEVSTGTIRNDLRELEKLKLVTRTHGGVLLRSKTGLEMMASEKAACNHEAKVAIAYRALEQIENGDTLLIDAGSTTMELAKLLHARTGLTVVTNDLQIALVLEDIPGVDNLFLIGGAVRRNLHCIIPFNHDSGLSALIIDKAIMGANGFTLKNGATTPDVRQANLKKEMIACASNTLLLIDAQKVGYDTLAKFAEVSEISMMITDSINEDLRASIEAKGVMVISTSSKG